jgi:16S rRNA (adenine1518-N6/adenine1519-N6)-dimethyltransferase
VDPNTVRRIVAAADLAADDVVLEIGPGLGSLTLALAEAAGEVVAVEIDAGWPPPLRDVVAAIDNVEVVHADALRSDLGAVLGGREARLVANLPYNVATPLVFHALACAQVRDAFVMVQREVGERWAARPGDRLHAGVSLKLQLLTDVEVALTIPRTVFHPAPNVDSVMVRLTRRQDAPDPADVRPSRRADRRRVRAAAQDPPQHPRSVADPEVVSAAAAAAGIDLGARAETLSTADVRRLDAALRARGVDRTAD